MQFGPYHVRDVEFVAAFDVDAKKVGRDVAEAIGASENNTIRSVTCRRPGSPCSAGPPWTAWASTTTR
jgi:myo-inositol-1-phosphate synthase